MANFFESNEYLDAIKRVKTRLELASERNVNIFGNTWYTKHFTVNQVPHPTDSFKTLLEQKHLPIAASTVNAKSGEPLRMKDGLASLEQSIFSFAHGYRLDIDELRELMLMQLMPGQQANALNGIVKKLLDVTGKCVDGVHARLDVMILGALSNEGIFEFTAENDPHSPFIGQKVDFGFDQSHSLKEDSPSLQWTDANVDNASIDPVTLLDDVQRRSNIKFAKVLTDKSIINFLLKSKTMKAYLNTVQRPNLPITLASINQFLQSYDLPIFEVVERKVRVQDGDKTKDITPWTPGKLLFVPSDNFGTIETGMTDNEMGFPSEGVEYGHYGRIETSRFRLGEKEHSSYAEIFKARLNAVPSIDSILDMWSVKVK